MTSGLRALLMVAVISIIPGKIALAADALVARGKYIVKVGGCNDCHTPGYAQEGGNTPVDKWLTGNPVGFQGPWGTTFPNNLRLQMQTMSEQEWVKKAQTFQARPPMPWFNVHAMSEKDQRAIYRFVKSLGPSGEPAPEYVPPGKEAKNMYIIFTPVSPAQVALANTPSAPDKHAAIGSK
jgi:hypothetical protein